MDPSLRWDDSNGSLTEFTPYLIRSRHDSFSLLTSCATAPCDILKNHSKELPNESLLEMSGKNCNF